MCGICGQYNFRANTPVDREKIEAMARSMAHRGPDDEGFFLHGPLGLGFRRLSIIDLSGGHQPMSDAQETVWVVFNGEIYNFRELRTELEGFGHIFHTRSDTEVIIHGYKQWGKDVLNRLNGMFGLAIWDKEKRRLIVARDPMGIKLIYYRIENGELHFGSEIRPLTASGGVKPEPNMEAVYLFLRYRYTPSPLTSLKGVKKLAPGTCIIAENGDMHVERYWNYRPEPFDPLPAIEDAEDQLLDLYKQAVRRQMISDVPLGLLLSGGMDSGLLLGLMLNGNRGDTRTYTVGYDTDYRDDELDDAAETAQILGAQNHAVRLDRSVFESTLSEVVSILEEPICSASVVPMYYVCKAARTDIKVALMGQGPDELFGGYLRHIGVRYGSLWRGLSGFARGGIGALMCHLPRNETIKRALYSLAVPERMRRYKEVFSILPGNRIDALFQPGVVSVHCDDAVLEFWSALEPLMEKTDELGGLQFIEIRSSLPDELLMYADKISMAHSLEVRVPYLDLEVVRFVERLPASYKIRLLSTKWLHRRVCRNFLPERIINRKKRGFASNVVDDWFRQSLAGKVDRMLRDPLSHIYQFLRYGQVEQMLREHQTGRSDNHKILFSLVVLEEWLRSHVAC